MKRMMILLAVATMLTSTVGCCCPGVGQWLANGGCCGCLRWPTAPAVATCPPTTCPPTTYGAPQYAYAIPGTAGPAPLAYTSPATPPTVSSLYGDPSAPCETPQVAAQPPASMVAPMATRMPMALAAPANYGAELACGIPYAAEMACGIPYAAMEPDCGCMSGYSEMDEPYMMAPGEFVDPTPLAE